MKIVKIALLAFAVLLFIPSFSQKVTKKVTKEICDCFDKIDPKSPMEALKQESETCIMQGMMNNIDGLVKEYKIKEDDPQAADKMGQEIGKKLVKECPSALNIFIILGSDEEKPEDGEEEKKEGE